MSDFKLSADGLLSLSAVGWYTELVILYLLAEVWNLSPV